ncbi:MAG TPA: ABC transporter ATP-binding protein [Rectinema sp.]|nr:ABC transporter ATP-binding protein [Rectinema sp.]
METTEPLITVENLRVVFSRERKRAFALRGIDIDLFKNEIHGLVGESGSGKTVTAMSIMGLLPKPSSKILSGSIRFEGNELLRLSEEKLRAYRGRRIGMVFQEPSKFLNPAFTIGEQIRETLIFHLGLGSREAKAIVHELIRQVGLGEDDRAFKAYPHELSSGMKQRAMIAMAISCKPEILIADEPTTSLDVTLQKQILELLKSLNNAHGMGVLLISHDLAVIEQIADCISVIYAGKIVENAVTEKLFKHPLHPYTRLLLNSIPRPAQRGKRLATISGQVLEPEDEPPGCVFAPRCPIAKSLCFERSPELLEHEKGHLGACHFAGEPWNL